MLTFAIIFNKSKYLFNLSYMKRKLFKGIVVATAVVAAGAMVSSCNDYNEDALNAVKTETAGKVLELELQVSELAAKISELQPGKDGYTPYIGENGNWWINGVDTGKPAIGKDGHTPYIGENGNWWIAGEDTGIPAIGQDGLDGHSPKMDEDGFWLVWDDETQQWKNTGINGKGQKGEKGADGHSPYINTENGNWMVWNDELGCYEDSGQPARGLTGFSAYEIAVKNGFVGTEAEWLESLKGADGADGADAPVITSIVMTDDGTQFLFYFDDGSHKAVDVKGMWKCDSTACKNAVNVCKEVTKAFGLGDGILSDAQLVELGSRISKALSDIKDALNYINALKARVTGISVDGVRNNVFGMIKTPFGGQTNMLYGYYGMIDPAYEFDFPSTNPLVYADASVLLDDTNVDNFHPESTGKGNIFMKDLGEVYYTINPAEVDFTGIDVNLATSIGNGCGVSLTAANTSVNELSMGWTRGAIAPAGFYLSAATVDDFSNVEKIDINAEDYIKIAKDLKNNRSQTVADIVNAVKNSLAALHTKAYAIQVTSSDTISTVDGNSHVVKSPLDIQVALVKPVGYEIAAKLPTSLPGHTRIINFVNKTIKKVIEKVADNGNVNRAKELLEEFQSKLKYVEFGRVGDDEELVRITVKDAHGDVIGTAIITGAEFRDLFRALNEDIADFNDMLDTANDMADFGLELINKLQGGNLVDNVEKTVDDAINKVWEKLDKAYGAFEYRFELALFTSTANGIQPMRTSITSAVEVGSSFTCYMTNMNAELLVPAYKKHLVVTDAIGADDKKAAIDAVNASINKVYSGDTKTVKVSGLKSGVTYEFSYSGLDYAGKQQTRIFYVKCK